MQKLIQIGQHLIQQLGRSSKELCTMRAFYGQKGAHKEVMSGRKQAGSHEVPFLRGMAGDHQADCLTSADQEVPKGRA